MLRFEDVSRSFNGRAAVRGVSFDVMPGRLTGFVGANGAGKTTTMRMGMGLLSPDSGRVTWNGEPMTVEHQRRFGYMPEERGLYPQQEVLSQLVFFGEIHGMPRRRARQQAMGYLSDFGLEDRAGQKLDELSLGNQQRVQIIASLLHEPICLILDEPFSGLDPIAVEAMGGVLKERARQGVPILFSSHQLELVQRLCDDLVILDAGEVRQAGSSEELLRSARQRYRIESAGDLAWLAELPSVRVVSRAGHHVAEIEVVADADVGGVVAAVVERSGLLSFSEVDRSLADLYLEGAR